MLEQLVTDERLYIRQLHLQCDFRRHRGDLAGQKVIRLQLLDDLPAGQPFGNRDVQVDTARLITRVILTRPPDIAALALE